MHWRRKWQPPSVFLPGESQGRGSLMGCHLWGRREWDMTEATQQQQQQMVTSLVRGGTGVETDLSFPKPGYTHVLELHFAFQFNSVQFSSVAQSCPTLCNPMNHSTPGLPVHHQLPEFTQTHIHRVGNAIQPSHPLSSPSPPALNPSQHQSFPMSQHFA